mgnify:CR=1 FL=1
MSRYSGKCDFGDTYEILGERMKNADVFIGDNKVPLELNSKKDALPYFPFIVGLMGSSDEKTVIYLSSESYVDEHEREILDMEWLQMQRLYRKLAKKGIPTVETLIAGSLSQDVQMAQAMIDMKGKGSRPDNLTLSYLDYYRENLYKDMIASGYDEDLSYRWAYGFKRWLSRIGKGKAED